MGRMAFSGLSFFMRFSTLSDYNLYHKNIRKLRCYILFLFLNSRSIN
ncbi:hypothetical protein BACFIN_08447 [Bacteroides finegoldii DSM 17565]|nr:hypothetical protein BACFIN_08447 [Bacteroides finegoldii DSM 17565]